MQRVLSIIFALALLSLLTACSSDAPIYTGPPSPNLYPPAGNNPGSTIYQLQAYIELSKDLGNAPLPVNMHAVVLGGLPPYYYRWDVNGDGYWDYGGFDVSEIGIHYASAGIYTILLEVEDSSGQIFRATAQVQVNPSGPSAVPLANPPVGQAPLSVTLDGSQSFDLDGYIVLYEWDFTSDGVFDFKSDTTGVTTFQYNKQGTYNATLRVTDDDGFKDQASVQIVVL